MPKQIRRHLLCRALAALALLALAGCLEPDVRRASYFELLGTSPGTACDAAPPGELRLEGVDVPALLLVSGAELCAGAPLRRELPPGLYALSWRAAYDGPGESELLRGPAVVSLFSGQVTRLRVQLEAPPGALVSSAQPPSEAGAERPAAPSACNGHLDGSGAS